MEQANLLDQSVGKAFAKYVSLGVLSMLGLSLYVLTDTFFVANGVGSGGLVALNLSLPMYGLIYGIGLLFGIGGGTLFALRRGEALAKGEDARSDCDRIFTCMMRAGLCCGLVFTACGLLLNRQIAGLLGARDEMLPLCAEYVGTIMAFSIAFIFNNIMVAFVRNDGAPQLAMTSMMVGSVANIILDYVFIYPLNMGLFGAALATGIAPVLGICVNSLHLLRGRSHFGLCRARAAAHTLSHAAAAGLSAMISEVSAGVVIFVFNGVLLGLTGNIGVAAYGIIANVSLVCLALFNGVGQGIQPIISQNYGAGRMPQVARALGLGCLTAVLGGALFYGVGLLFPHVIAAAFNKAGDPLLTAYTVDGIRLYFSAFLMMGLNIVLTAFLAATAYGRRAFLLSMMRGFIAMIPAVLILPRFWGLEGVWLAIPITEGVTLLLGLVFLLTVWPHFRQFSKLDQDNSQKPH